MRGVVGGVDGCLCCFGVCMLGAEAVAFPLGVLLELGCGAGGGAPLVLGVGCGLGGVAGLPLVALEEMGCRFGGGAPLGVLLFAGLGGTGAVATGICPLDLVEVEKLVLGGG